MFLKVADSVREVYPEAHFATMAAHGVDTPADRVAFEALKAAEIAQIMEMHQAYDRKTATSTPPMSPYVTHYKRFKKTYQVMLQLESVLFKGRGIPSVNVPVEAMFLAELKHLLLGGGYDLDTTTGDVEVAVSTGTETFGNMAGEEQTLQNGDLYLHDGAGLLGNIIYGPAHRTCITDASRNVLFLIYGVPGVPIADTRRQLADLGTYLKAGLPGAELEPIRVWAADGTEVVRTGASVPGAW